MRSIVLAALAASAVAGCGSIAVNPADPRRAVALAPYERAVQPFGVIRIAEGTPFYPATADGAAAWCSAVPTYFLPGDQRALCMIDTGPAPEGWFKAAFPSGSYSGTRLAVDVPYRVAQTAPLPPRR